MGQYQQYASTKFANVANEWAKSNIVSATLGHVPRIIFETLCFTLIVFAMLGINNSDTKLDEALIPMLTLYVISVYRVLPSFNRMFAALNEISFQLRSLDIIYDTLRNEKREELSGSELQFSASIELKKISFNYSGRNIFQNLTVTINKSDKVCVFGETGSGKSTLIDVIMGLQSPNDGTIFIDGKQTDVAQSRHWRTNFGYVPQNVYLFDGSVAENVAFGEAPNTNRLIELLKAVQLWDILEQRQGLQTNVGEGGVSLSGGQKQRLAIARALYKNPKILILDEATNALDTKTEDEILRRIMDRCADKTVIFITHNSALKQYANNLIDLSERDA